MQRYVTFIDFPVELVPAGFAYTLAFTGNVGRGRSSSRHFCEGAY